MSQRPSSRRVFLQSSLVAGGLICLGGESESIASSTTARVRRNFGKLDPNITADQRLLGQLSDGIKALRARSDANLNDRIGWSVQAGIHSYRCQHGNWWFLPWHRMYLYFFERIMRAAVGDDFALPYWDWTDPAQASLPAAFRDSSSPLYDGNRLDGVNSGAFSLDWSGYAPWGGVLNYSVNLPDFVPDLGSQAVTSPGSYPQHGALEVGPHDTVHVWVAGSQTADMGIPFYAALDPIFWLHHANIDRIWAKWKAQAANPVHQEPTSTTWQNQAFSFYDENRAVASLTVSQVVNTEADPLNYRYDDVPSPPVRLAVPLKTIPGPETGQPAPIASAAPKPNELGAAPLTVKLPLSPEARTKLERSLQGVKRTGEAAPTVQLSIEGIKFTEGASAEVTVFLNLPDPNRRENVGKPHAVGIFSHFEGHGNHDGAAKVAGGEPEVMPVRPPARGAEAVRGQDEPGVTAVFNVTENVRGLRQSGAWKDEELSVTLVRRDLNADDRVPRTRITFSRVTLQAR